MSNSALIVIDMLNTYEHEDAEVLARSVERVVPQIRQLVERARDGDVLTLYVNDSYGDWTAGRPELSEAALAGEHGRQLVEPIAPTDDVVFVTKGRHSVFYETQVEYILREAGVERLILAGQVTEQCVLYSALDAYVRQFQIVVPRDAVAHIHEDLAEAALRMMEVNMGAEITDSQHLTFDGS